MITVEAVTKRYGQFTAVDDVTFSASAGRVTGFVVPNGPTWQSPPPSGSSSHCW